MSFLKFRLLLWKNFLIQKRKPITTFFEIGLPTLFSFLLMGLRLIVPSKSHLNVTEWEFRDSFILAFSPGNELTDRIMERVNTTLEIGSGDNN
ncbi:unnamed protein product, partial [Candidula unifasciata]